MKKLFLNSLELKNFKGVKDLKVNFSQNTIIEAANRAGKTSVFDAYLWLMCDVDSNFNAGIGEIKPYDSANKIIHNIETTVTGNFSIDGVKLVLQKTIKEVWKNETSFQNTIVYRINNTVCGSKKEFQERLDSICESEIMQLLLFPLSFFGKKYDTAKRRSFITGLTEIAEVDKSEWLTNQLKNVHIDTLKKSLQNTIKKSKEEISNYQARIDENLMLIKEVDSESAFKEIIKINAEIKELQLQLSSIKEGEEHDNKHYLNCQKRISELEKEKQEKTNLFHQLKSEFNFKKESKINTFKRKISEIETDIETAEKEIAKSEKRIIEINEKRVEINKLAEKNVFTTFDENAAICPTCKREFQPEKVEDLKENFNSDKVKNHNNLLAESLSLKEEKADREKDIEKIKEETKNGIAIIEKSKESILKIVSIEFQKLDKKQIDYFYSAAETKKVTDFLTEILFDEKGCINFVSIDIAIEKLKEEKPASSKTSEEKRDSITKEIELKNQYLGPLREITTQSQLNDSTEKRILQLRSGITKETDSIQECTDYLNEIGDYIKTKMELTESEVNKLFSFIKVSMFETLQNGNISDICEITADGVPFTVLNTESKTNALIDLSNAISKRYGIQLPIFADNRESTAKIIDTDLQTVNLYHVPGSEFVVK